jgi:uncharacterized membrane protein
MKLLGNPFIGEDLSAAFSRTPALRAYLAFMAVMSGILLVWWPRSPLASYLRTGVAPDSFISAALGLLGCAVYVSARMGAEDFSEEGSSKVRDFVTLTPVPVSVVVAGKLVTAVLHTLFLLLLGLPFLVIGSSVNGTPIPVMCKAVLVAGSFALAFRALAFLGFAILGTSKVLKDTILLFIGVIWLSVTTSVIAPLSPISAILSLDPGNPAPAVSLPLIGASIPFFAVSVTISAFSVAIFSVSAAVWLRAVRKAHAKRRTESPARAMQTRAERLLKGPWDDTKDEHDGP